MALLKSQNLSGAYSATQPAADAERVEYFVPSEKRSRIAIGWLSTVAAPVEISCSSVARLASSNVPHTGHM